MARDAALLLRVLDNPDTRFFDWTMRPAGLRAWFGRRREHSAPVYLRAALEELDRSDPPSAASLRAKLKAWAPRLKARGHPLAGVVASLSQDGMTRRKFLMGAAAVGVTAAAASRIGLTVLERPRPDMAYEEQDIDVHDCAKFVINILADIHPRQSILMRARDRAVKEFLADACGIAGNAWTMHYNLMRKGTSVYNAFDGMYAKYGASIAKAGKLRDEESSTGDSAEFVRSLFPETSGVDVAALKVGDIVGLYFDHSAYQVRAFNEGRGPSGGPRTFNTHVGVVSSVKGGEVLVAHNISSELNVDRADEMLSKHSSTRCMIVWVARPSIFSKIFPMGTVQPGSTEQLADGLANRVETVVLRALRSFRS